MTLFKALRIFILLMILIGVALGSWLTSSRSTDWVSPLWIAIYPINGDGKASTQKYIEQLQLSDFESIETFMADEATEYKLALKQPFKVILAPQVTTQPPSPPNNSATAEIILWSLKLRYWAFQANTYQGAVPHIRVFVKYFDQKGNTPLAHSLGLQQGMLGIVNAFAISKMSPANAMVITHEILHTLGATDKYDLSSGQPHFPDGYADSDQSPLHPQEFAEVMAGKIPISHNEIIIPRGLYQVVIGEKTAKEIKWIE
ncbi:MAG: hypothetical protein QM484_13485 [Woeseiaceae bacterium]